MRRDSRPHGEPLFTYHPHRLDDANAFAANHERAFARTTSTCCGAPVRFLAKIGERVCVVCEQPPGVCPKCSGTAISQTFTSGTPDFPGDTVGITLSPGGPGEVVAVLKCRDCGHSITT